MLWARSSIHVFDIIRGKCYVYHRVFSIVTGAKTQLSSIQGNFPLHFFTRTIEIASTQGSEPGAVTGSRRTPEKRPLRESFDIEYRDDLISEYGADS